MSRKIPLPRARRAAPGAGLLPALLFAPIPTRPSPIPALLLAPRAALPSPIRALFWRLGPLLLVLAAVLAQGCGEKKDARHPPTPFVAALDAETAERVARVLTGVSAGILRRDQSVELRFAYPLAGEAEWGADLDPKLLRSEPRIPGRLFWRDAQTLLFEPEKPLRPGASHHFTADLAALARDEKLPEYGFSVTILPQSFSFAATGLLEDPQKRGSYLLAGRLETAYPLTEVRTDGRTETLTEEAPGARSGEAGGAEAAEGSELFAEAMQGRRKARLEIRPMAGAGGASYEVKIRDLDRNPKEPLFLSFGAAAKNGKKAEAAGAVAETVRDTFFLPAPGTLGILAARAREEEGAEGFEVLFSDEPAPAPELEGLVRVNGEAAESRNGNLRVTGRMLSVSTRLTGEKKIELVLEKGLRGRSPGLVLPEEFRLSHAFRGRKPAVRFLGKGAILPTALQDRLPFETLNLGAVEVEVLRVYESNMPHFLRESSLSRGYWGWERVGKTVMKRTYRTGAKAGEWQALGLDLRPLLKTHGSGLFVIQLKKQRDGMLYPCPEGAGRGRDGAGGEDAAGGNPDGGGDAEGEGGVEEGEEGEEGAFSWEERDDPCRASFWSGYYGERVSLNVMVSDLSLLASKDEEGNLEVTALDLLTAEPWAGAKIAVYGAQSQKTAEGETDKEGFARFQGAQEAVLVKAEARGADGALHPAYLRLEAGESKSLSRFDAGGAGSPGAVRLFPFSDRGVYRPGDSLFLGCLARGEDGLPLSHLPVRLSLKDPRGRILAVTVKKAEAEGHYLWRTATRPEDATGRYQLLVEAGPVTVSHPLLVETIRPNRLRLEMAPARASEEFQALREGAFLPGLQSPALFVLRSAYLSGAGAGGLKTKVEYRFTAEEPAFKGFSDYTFHNEAGRFPDKAGGEAEGRLDARGLFAFPIRDFSQLPVSGFLGISFRSRVFEPGGEASKDLLQVTVSPFSHYAGIALEGLSPHGEVEAGSPLSFRLASVSEAGAESRGRSLEVKVYHNPHYWWMEQEAGHPGAPGRGAGGSGSGEGAFTERAETRLLKTFEAMSGSKAEFAPPSRGRYLVLVRDKASGHRAGKFFEAWSHVYGGSEGPAPAQMTLEAQQDTVSVGDKFTVRFPMPKGSKEARALVQVMRGRRMLSRRWLKTDEETGIFTARAEAGMAPGIYVQVHVLQPFEARNDRPVRMYGVIPITVLDEKTRLPLEVAAPASVRPETPLRVGIKNPSGKPGEVTLFVVDEGLLNLTRHKTPRPWDFFYAKEALSVRSWDFYDEVIGGYAGRLGRLLSLGGSEEMGSPEEAATGNRFAPMVFALGPLALPAKGMEVQVPIPRYTGSVRIMAVASSGAAFGAAEKEVKVKSPLMILGTVPRALSPGEKAEVPVTVFSDRAGSVNLAMTVAGPLRGSPPRQVVFEGPGEKTISFDLEASGVSGEAGIFLKASSGAAEARQDLQVRVRYPGPRRKQAHFALLREPVALEIRPFGLPGTRSARMEIVSGGVPGLESRIEDLLQYPHGCLEQTVSAAFPQIFLPKLLPALPASRRAEADAHVKAALEKLKRFQARGGGLALWPGEPYPHEWASLWALNFMEEARAAGHVLPEALYGPLLGHAREAARSFRKTTYSTWEDTLAQVMRLDLLARAGKPDLGSLNRLRGAPLRDVSRVLLAAAYRTAGQAEASRALLLKTGFEVQALRQQDGTFASPLRDRALILEALARMGLPAERLYADLRAEFRRSDAWLSTQETGALLWAFARMREGAAPAGNPEARPGKNPGTGAGQVEWRLGPGPWKRGTLAAGRLAVDLPPDFEGRLEVKAEGFAETPEFLLTQSGQPGPGEEEKPYARGLRLKVAYYGRKAENSGQAGGAGSSPDRANGVAGAREASGATGAAGTGGSGGAFRPLDPSRLSQGQDFVSVTEIENQSGRRLRNLALTRIYPGGWEIRNGRVEGEGAGLSFPGMGTPSAPRRLDIRDDRTYHYFDLEPGQKAFFVTALNAAYQGSYRLPAAQVEALYDPYFGALVAGGRAEVVEGP